MHDECLPPPHSQTGSSTGTQTEVGFYSSLHPGAKKTTAPQEVDTGGKTEEWERDIRLRLGGRRTFLKKNI